MFLYPSPLRLLDRIKVIVHSYVCAVVTKFQNNNTAEVISDV
jgi:hypothetical protein